MVLRSSNEIFSFVDMPKKSNVRGTSITHYEREGFLKNKKYYFNIFLSEK
jgi:hypothetical protein